MDILSDHGQEHGEIETLKDIGPGPAGLAARWLAELRIADKAEAEWRKRASELDQRYRDEATASSDTADVGKAKTKFNIFWSNTETLKPAIFGSMASPDVRRRHDQKNTQPQAQSPEEQRMLQIRAMLDEQGREMAIVLERALQYSLDTYDPAGEVDRTVQDYLITGRGVIRVHFKQTLKTQASRIALQQGADGRQYGPEGAVDPHTADIQRDAQGTFQLGPDEEVADYEEVTCEHVHWPDFRRGPGKRWSDVPWEAFRHEMTRKDLRDNFDATLDGKRIADEVPLTVQPKFWDLPAGETIPDLFKRAEVWEVWDKVTKTVIFVSPGYHDAPLDVRDDPTKLKGFFPNPEPIYSVRGTGTLVPRPEFALYQSQANELDDVSERIDALIAQLKVRGVYNNTLKELDTLLERDDGTMVGVANWQTFAQAGGFAGAVDILPIDAIAQVLLGLYQQRDQLIQIIYQVTGISDIQRGSTDPRETKGAQELKSQYGSLRLAPRQKLIARMIRDVMRLKAELIAENFSAETLMNMSGRLVRDEMVALLRDEGQRGFAIDIETDSTVAPDEHQDKTEAVEYLGAMSEFMQMMAKAEGMIPLPMAIKMMLWVSRRFKVSRELELYFEQMMNQQAQQQGQGQQDGQARADQAKAQIEGQKLQLDAQKAQMSAQEAQAKLQVEVLKAKLKAEEAAGKIELEGAKLSMEQEIALAELDQKQAELDTERRKIIGDQTTKYAEIISRERIAARQAAAANRATVH
jgi:hypothetical protein